MPAMLKSGDKRHVLGRPDDDCVEVMASFLRDLMARNRDGEITHGVEGGVIDLAGPIINVISFIEGIVRRRHNVAMLITRENLR